MDTGPTLKEKQLAWAIAWQDHGDRAALALLCQSVEAYVVQQAGKRAFDQEMRKELLAEYRLAVVEAAGLFDRERPEGFVSLCRFLMLNRSKQVYRHRSSPATVPEKVWAPAGRVAIVGQDDEQTVDLVAPEPYAESTPGLDLVKRVADDAGLTAREWRAFQRHFRGESKMELAEIWGCTQAYVYQNEQSAFRKIRAALQARGLELEDLL